ncbi:MAG: glycoside hydrolase family 130 protein [Planctomycetota bacterium]
MQFDSIASGLDYLLQPQPASGSPGILRRHAGNPLLTPRDMPVPCAAVYNGGVVQLGDGSFVMMNRFEAPSKSQHVWTSRSVDGLEFTPDSEPVRFVPPQDPYQRRLFDQAIVHTGPKIGTWWDPRICPVQTDVGLEYFVTYAAVGDPGCRIGLGKTSDFKSVEHVSFPHHIVNRNAVLFPEKIDGDYWMLHRPQRLDESGDIWISRSPDLRYWGDCQVVAKSERFWEKEKIGPAAPPVRTEHGWMIVYHGVFGNCNGYNYGAGVMFLDLDRPWEVVARATSPILTVEAIYEMVGQVPNVVFPGGAIVGDDGTISIYYGAADYVQCLAHTSLDELWAHCDMR